MVKTKYKKTFFYRDELNDDFAKIQIRPKNIDEKFKYSHGKVYWFFAILIRFFVIPILYVVSKICYGTTIKNKKVLKKLKNRGYFIYSNHTTAFDPINHACLVNPTKYSLIIASVDALSIKGIGWLVHLFGAIPVPNNLKMYKNFSQCLKYNIEKKHKIVIYPEAHIWPYYTDIRPFKSVSFRYPVELNAPIVVSTTTIKRRKFFHTPKLIITLSNPIFPNKDLTFKEQINDLRNKTYEIMKAVSENSEKYEYYHYEKL